MKHQHSAGIVCDSHRKVVTNLKVGRPAAALRTAVRDDTSAEHTTNSGPAGSPGQLIIIGQMEVS